MRIAGPSEQREQGISLLLGSEGDVGKAGRAAEDGHLLSHHVPVDGERRDRVGRLADHHLEAVERRDVARPGDAPGQLLERRPGDRRDPLLVLEALREAACLQPKMKAVVGGATADIAVVEQRRGLR